MPEIVECPSCRRQLKVPETLINQRVKCPSCGTPFEAVPSSVPPSAAPPAPPPPPAPAAPARAPEQVSAASEPVPRASSGGTPSGEKPGKVQAIGLMTLIGGILAIVNFLAIGGGSGLVCCLWPGLYYGLVVGIMAIVKGAALIGVNAANETAPKAIAIMQIINIINLDLPNCVMGILTLVFLGDPEVAACYRDATPAPPANG